MHRLLFLLLLYLAIGISVPAAGQESPPDLAEIVLPAGDPWDWDHPIPPIAMDGIQYALAAQLMSLEDLTYQKDPVDDPYRLPIVTQTLEDPLSVYNITWAFGHRFESQNVPAAMLSEQWLFNLMQLSDPSGGEEGWKVYEKAEALLTGQPSELEEWFRMLTVHAQSFHAIYDDFNDEQLAFLKAHAHSLVVEDAADPPEILGYEDFTEMALEAWDAVRHRYEGTAHTGYLEEATLLAASLDALVRERACEFEHEAQFLECIAPLPDIATGRVVIGTMGSDVFEVNPGDWIIDPGGNDIYNTQMLDLHRPLKNVIIDFGGDDLYNGGIHGSVGGGYFGTSILIDHAGDDTYRSAGISQGAGLFGCGFLFDHQGNDIYSGGDFVQGAGMFGIGLLVDDAGNDHYHATLYGQAAALTGGLGMLIERDGNDTYTAGGAHPDYPRWPDNYLSLSQGFAIGLRPRASGGVAFLGDYAGNDNYSVEVYGQGVSYWYSLAMLLDKSGNDWYECLQYGQGAGIHLSSGCLIDVDGSDHYTGWSLLQGGGHDLGVGAWLDMNGRDFMHANDLSQGAGQANGFGIAIDLQGDDSWLVREEFNTQGYGNPRRDYGSIGLFIDVLGKDQYSIPWRRNAELWTQSKWGAGFDMANAEHLAPVKEIQVYGTSGADH